MIMKIDACACIFCPLQNTKDKIKFFYKTDNWSLLIFLVFINFLKKCKDFLKISNELI